MGITALRTAPVQPTGSCPVALTFGTRDLRNAIKCTVTVIATSEYLKQKLLKFYNISEDRRNLMYGGIFLPGGNPMGSAYIGTSIYNSCEFSRKDAPVPQTYCRRIVKDYLIKYYNHIHDFEENQKRLDKIESMMRGL